MRMLSPARHDDRANPCQCRYLAGHSKMLSDNDAADLIRGDGIDILVDLAMAHGRKPADTFRPQAEAAVQITYLAYCSSTGMRSRWITVSATRTSKNRRVRTSQCFSGSEVFACRRPTGVIVAFRRHARSECGIPALPGGPHLGAAIPLAVPWNNFCKMSERALAVWADILRKVPRSTGLPLLHAIA